MAYNPVKTRTWKDGATPASGTPALGSLFNAEFQRLYDNFAALFAANGLTLSVDVINEKTGSNGVIINDLKADTVDEKTGSAGVTIDGTTIKDGVLTDDGSLGIGIEEVNGDILRKIIVPIGDWNMDSTGTVDVNHGLTHTKIRSVAVLIREDTDSWSINLNFDSGTGAAGSWIVYSTYVRLQRYASKTFDDTDYDSTSYNRGWMIISYID